MREHRYLPFSSLGCSIIFWSFDLLLEAALERDYYMTGNYLSHSNRVQWLTLLRSSAQEALEFGIVDGILEKRPAMDADASSGP